MIAVDILFDGVFAAVAAIGFGAISDPPVRAFPYIALLAAEGDFSSLPDISLAEDDTLTIGRKVYVAGYPYGMPFTITEGSVSSPKQLMDGKYYIQTDAAVNPGNSGGPALLPMVPGIYAYKTVFALIMFLQSLNDPGQGLEYMQQFFLNATVSFSVIILLAAGATLPIFIFNRRAFSLTRRRRSRE